MGITDIYTDEIPEHIIDRRKKLYRIYSDAVTFLVEQLRKEYGHCLIIDLHSYDQEPAEYELHKNERRPKICVGTNRKSDETVLTAKLDRYSDIVGFNEPFSGSYIPEIFIDDKYVTSVMECLTVSILSCHHFTLLSVSSKLTMTHGMKNIDPMAGEKKILRISIMGVPVSST